MAKVLKGGKLPEGKVRHHGRGKCVTCINREHWSRTRGGTVSVEDHRRHLDSWLAERRARGIPADGLLIG